MNEVICRAIREQRLLELQYHGHTRRVAPHVYGIDGTGDEVLSCYQIWGGSESGEEAGWKSFKVHAITELKLTTRRFGARPEYRHGDPAMKEIFCQIG
jgi:hypothetical protein